MTNPGEFPQGVTTENILWTTVPRNRRIAEVFLKCGLVERAGQGAARLFEQNIRECRPQPDYSMTDRDSVVLTLRGEVQDENFVKFLETIGQETLASFSTEDFLAPDLIHRERRLPEYLRYRVLRLRDLGLVEVLRRGRAPRYKLSRRSYSVAGQ